MVSNGFPDRPLSASMAEPGLSVEKAGESGHLRWVQFWKTHVRQLPNHPLRYGEATFMEQFHISHISNNTLPGNKQSLCYFKGNR